MSLPPSFPAPLIRIPTMEELGFKDCTLYTSEWIGGETEAMRRLPLYSQIRCQNIENTVSLSLSNQLKTSYKPV